MKYRHLTLAALIMLSAAAQFPVRAEPATPIMNIGSGEGRTIRVSRPLSRIVVGERGVIDTVATGTRSIRVTGLKPGRTTLTLFASDGSMLASYAIQVSGAEADLARHLAAELGLENVDVSRAGETILLSGPVPDQERRNRANVIAKAYAGEKIADLTNVTGQQMVAVDVQFAAVSAGTLKALGFNFAKLGGDIQGALATPNSVNSFSLPNRAVSAPFDIDTTTPIQSAFNLFLSNPAHGITAVLSALSSAGLSEILAQPTLLVRSGDEASFLAGGEVPVPVPQGGNNSGTVAIDYREFGVRLDVAAQVLSDKRIVLKLTPEVSELDYANGVRMQGYVVPGLRRRSATTTVQLGSGQSFVIAGLNYSNSNVSSEKLPLLADLPVIGGFFRRTQNTQERQELIIIATPRLVEPLPPGQLPPLPGQKDGPYNPSLGQMATGKADLDKRLSDYGLMRR